MGTKQIYKAKRFERRVISSNGVTGGDSIVLQLPQSRVGADDPMWKLHVARGLSATNFLTASKREADFIPSKLDVKLYVAGAGWIRRWDESHHPYPEVALLATDGKLLSLAQDEAAMRVRKKIIAEQKTFSGPTFLGELHKAAQMIRKPADALAKRLNQYVSDRARKHPRPKSWKQRNNWSKTAADSYLEGIMGWAPLISDIAGIAEATLKRYEYPEIFRVFGASEVQSSLSKVKSSSTSSSTDYYYTHDQIDTVRVKYTAGISRTASRSNNGLERVVEYGAFDWREILPTAWELLPWSFLADYFGNIGDVIAAASMSMSDVKWVCRGTKRETEIKTIGLKHVAVSTDYPIYSSEPGFARYFLSSYERTSASIPIPGFRFEMPGNSRQLSSVAALMASKFL
nr:MAG: hypothetical protein 1 [Leviviridae sp.]